MTETTTPVTTPGEAGKAGSLANGSAGTAGTAQSNAPTAEKCPTLPAVAGISSAPCCLPDFTCGIDGSSLNRGCMTYATLRTSFHFATPPETRCDGTPVPSVTAPTSPAPSADADLGCEAVTLVAKHCTSCHGATPAFGAPMSLMTPADFGKASVGDSKRTVAEVVRTRINAADNKRMPPASSPALSAAELDTLNDWLDAGATAGSTCPQAGPTATTPMTDKPAQGKDPVALDPSVKCYTFAAHGTTKEQAFKVGLATDAYYNFTFNAPWTGMQYAKAFRTKIDNKQVVHHWLLFKEGGPVSDGAMTPSSGAHPGGQLVHGWAPGGEDLVMNEEVGIELPATGFTLELHYNSKDDAAMDKSGVEVCVTPNKPKNVAGISWLGTDAISGTSATGTCTPDTGMPIRILGGTPHMHTAGTRMKVEILRRGGMVEILHDAAFDFNYQRAYDYQDRNITLMPGDAVRTTCTYNKPVSFGEGTGDEMCYFFTLHYPANALTSVGLGQVIHGPNTCGVL